MDLGPTFFHIAFVVVFVIAGMVKGITGMGLPTVAISLLGLWMPPLQAAALLVLPSLVTNLAQCRGPQVVPLARRLWPVWLALAATTVWAPGLGGGFDGPSTRRLLGAVLLAYGGWGLVAGRWRAALPDASGAPRWLLAVASIAVGAATGALTALTAVFVMPLVPWLQVLRLPKEAMVQALGLSFTVATLALAMRLQVLPGVGQGSAASWLALAAALVGLALGGAIRGRLSQGGFQRGLFLAFIGLGLANLWQAG